MESSVNKKPFDKKKWRENKYGHSAKVDQWKNRRQQFMERKYVKFLRKEAINTARQSNNPNLEPLGAPTTTSAPSQPGEKQLLKPPKRENKPALPSFKETKAQLEKRQKDAERKQRKEDKRKRFEERKAAREEYRKKKTEKFKLINKKNKRGQPIMAGRMEMLLDRIQKLSD